MKFYPFYLFYILTIGLLAFGMLATKAEPVLSLKFLETGMMVEKNFNRPYFLTASIISLLTGLIYHGLFKRGKIANKIIIIIHFSIASLSILFSLNLYRLILLLVEPMAPDTTSLASGEGGLLLMLLGPLLVLASLVLFVVGLVTAKRIQN
ncbi:MAG TPA: hypothetical protein VGF30_01875 [Bacteroidia bacterium]